MINSEGVIFDEEDQSYASTENSPLISSSTQRESSIQSGLKTINPLPGMIIRSHFIGKKGELSSCTPSEALAGGKSGKKNYWIDIDADPEDTEELHEWLRKLNLPNFVIEILSEPPETWTSQVIPLQRACLAVIRILPKDTKSDDMAHLAALSLRNILITFTSCPRRDTGGLFAPALAQMKQAERFPSASSSGALIAWLRFHLDRTSRSIRELRYAVLGMDAAMDRDITSVHVEELIAVKDQLLRLLSVAEEQCECVESLMAATTGSDNGLDFSSVKGSMASLVASAGGTERMALRLEKHIIDLRQRSEQHEHSKMNRRLAVLTVLSAIFLPLTLLTGIWGMNFEAMPELSKPYSYPVALFFMFSLASLMIYYFHKGGWFD